MGMVIGIGGFGWSAAEFEISGHGPGTVTVSARESVMLKHAGQFPAKVRGGPALQWPESIP